MAIQIGDRIPEVKLRTMAAGRDREVSTGELFRGKRAVLFAVPGAFTPTCSDYHLPGFVEHADEHQGEGGRPHRLRGGQRPLRDGSLGPRRARWATRS